MDADLQLIRDHAKQLTPVGVKRLVDALQSQRDAARLAAALINDVCGKVEDESSLLKLTFALSACLTTAGELQRKIEAEHIDLGELR